MKKIMEKFEFKGTPREGGNWEINVNNPKQVLIDNVCIIDQGMNIPGVLEDAYLISAAPLLLSALIKIVEEATAEGVANYCLDNAIHPEKLGEDVPLKYFPDYYHEAKAAIQAAISQPENVKG